MFASEGDKQAILLLKSHGRMLQRLTKKGNDLVHSGHSQTSNDFYKTMQLGAIIKKGARHLHNM